MILDLPSGKYRLMIEHVHPHEPKRNIQTKDGRTVMYDRRVQAATSAVLHKHGPADWDFVGRAYAACAVGDQFRRKVGVRMAVSRLIKDFPRAERALIWARVWNLKPTKAEHTGPDPLA
jgi:hypothetical protein